MDFFLTEPDFSAWPISESLKTLLLQEDQWPGYFSLEPDQLAVLLNSLNLQIKDVNFFNNLPETNLFFNFLRDLVESKPQESNVLKEFSEITVGVLDKLRLESYFNSQQTSVAIYYLELVALMLEPNYRYLFDKPEISVWTNDFQKISNHTFDSSALLSQFRNTLQLSFQSTPFIRNYPVLIQTIRDLACSLNKTSINSNTLEAMKLLDTLGVLDHTLKTSQIRVIEENRVAINQSIQDTRKLIYNQFEPYVEADFLKFIVYQSYLKQSYPNSANLSELCDSDEYRAQCKSDVIRYADNYRCAMDQLANFSIEIKNNNRSERNLDQLCVAMRKGEWFVSWMEGLGFKSHYNTSQFNLYLADSIMNFLEDKLLFESDESEETFTVRASYYPAKKRGEIGLGSAYSATTQKTYNAHEYNHHLFSQYMNDLELDLTLTEGLAELFSGGICSEKNIRDLRNFINDTFIFKFLEVRKYPFYFNALKWAAYLVNEQLELFKVLLNFLHANDLNNFYAILDNFIGNATNINAFVNWSQQHVNTCNYYLDIFPDGHQPPLIYLADIKGVLNQTQTAELSTVNSNNILQDFLHYSGKDVHAFFIRPYSPDKTKIERNEFSQQMEMGIPLPITALFAGFTSACLDNVSLVYKDKHPSLPAYIHYGFKPFLFAAMSAGLNTLLFDEKAEIEEKIARLFSYFVMNYLSVLIGQPMTKKLAEKIHNKLLCFFVQTALWTLLWNPSLFMSEDSRLLPTLFLQLIQGLCFKLGEESYQLIKSSCFPSSFWHTKQKAMITEDDSLSDDVEMQLANTHFTPSRA